MRKLFDLLTRKEKGILGILVLLVIGAVCVFLFVGISPKRSFVQAEEGKKGVEEELVATRIKRDRTADEWESWQNARQDFQRIKEDYLYGVKDALPLMRADVQHLLLKENIRVPQIQYEYEDFKNENIRLIRFSFTVRGSYYQLKSLIREIETLPHFLVLGKIDFIDIQSRTGILTLRIHLLGYHNA